MKLLPFLLPVIAVAFGIALVSVFGDHSGWGFLGIVIIAIGAVACIVVFIGAPVTYYSTKCELAEMEEVRRTLKEARTAEMSEMERAALVLEVARRNAWLKGCQYWRGTMFGYFYPEDVNTTEFLK